MLTGDLVRVRSVKKVLKPSFIDPGNSRMLDRAEELLGIYLLGQRRGWTRGQLRGEVNELIGDGIDHKLVRGMAKVLEDRAEFAMESPVPPSELRTRLFEAVATDPSRENAARAYALAAEELGLTVEQLRGALFADRKDEQQLMEVKVPGAGWLLHRYNVALVQAVLIKAEAVRVTLKNPQPERMQQLFRQIKFQRLMYRVKAVKGGQQIILDGPVSLLRFSTRYGMALANWFPSLLLQSCPWTMVAELRWTRRKLRRNMTLSNELGLRSHYRDTGAYVTRTEQWFQDRFEALDSGWTLTREGVTVNLGGLAVVCPDFTFRKGDRVAHLDIVGFWRKEWLQNRLALLQEHGPGNLVLAVSTRMEGAKEGLEGFQGELVGFKEVVPAKQVLKLVEAIAVTEG